MVKVNKLDTRVLKKQVSYLSNGFPRIGCLQGFNIGRKKVTIGDLLEYIKINSKNLNRDLVSFIDYFRVSIIIGDKLSATFNEKGEAHGYFICDECEGEYSHDNRVGLWKFYNSRRELELKAVFEIVEGESEYEIIWRRKK